MSGDPQLPLEKPRRTISSFDSLFAFKPKYSLESLSAYSVQLLNLKLCARRGAAGSHFDTFQKSPDIFSKFQDRDLGPAATDAPGEDQAPEARQPARQPSKPKIRIEYQPLSRGEADRPRAAPIPNQPTTSLFGRVPAASCSSHSTAKELTY